jgi:Tol biopolymer transport system component
MRNMTGLVRVVGVSALLWSAAPGVGTAQTTTRVSIDGAGTQVTGDSRQPSASADGRYVAFASTAATLVAGDTNGSTDVFVKDRLTGGVTRVSVRTGGVEAVGDSVSPDISADGAL